MRVDLYKQKSLLQNRPHRDSEMTHPTASCPGSLHSHPLRSYEHPHLRSSTNRSGRDYYLHM